MPLSDDFPSSPGVETTPAQAMAYYKAQYETLEAELTEFQASSKELEAELEKDVEAAEKRERQLKEKADNLGFEVDEWRNKYRQSKTEASNAQTTLQKEITALRDTNRTQQLRLRDIEVANDDFERQQRNTESSLEDMESKYSVAIERAVLLEEEVKTGEQEREALRIDAQRLRDELSDLRIETEITKEKLRKAEDYAHPRTKLSLLEPTQSISPRSELSPTNSDSVPSFDTPPGKTSSSGMSDAPTPPSPPISENSAPKFKTPSRPKPRMSDNNTTPRPSTYALKPPTHTRGASTVTNGRGTPSTFRQSLSRPPRSQRPYMAQSNSIHQLHNLQGKMARLTERVHTAKSKLPGPVNTPPKSSPRGPLNPANLPASITLRSGRKRGAGSTISGVSGTESVTSQIDTPTLRRQTNRQSLPMAPPPPNASPFKRPSSRASAVSNSTNPSNPPTSTYSRPSSRTSTTRLPPSSPYGTLNSAHRPRPSLHNRHSTHFLPPNASTERIRPKSALSAHGLDGTVDDAFDDADTSTPTPRRNVRLSMGEDNNPLLAAALRPGSAAGKRTSISRLPRVSLGRTAGNAAGMIERPSSSRSNASQKGFMYNAGDAGEEGVLEDVDETF